MKITATTYSTHEMK